MSAGAPENLYNLQLVVGKKTKACCEGHAEAFGALKHHVVTLNLQMTVPITTVKAANLYRTRGQDDEVTADERLCD